MKKTSRLPLLLLLPALCASLLLGGCSKEPPTPPDQVATAFYDLLIRQDAAPLNAILGYESEDALWDDFVGGKENYQGAMVESLQAQFEQMGLTLSQEDSDKLFTNLIAALNKLEFSAEVQEMDEKNGTAVVSAHIGYYDQDALAQMAQTAVEAALADTDETALQTEEGIMEFLSAYLSAFCDGLTELEPAEGQKDITVDFEFIEVAVGEKTKEAWMPSDPERFGFDLSTSALGM